MFKLKNFETNTVTNFTPLTGGTMIMVDQDNDGHLGIQADMFVEDAREFWRKCVENGAVRVGK